MTWSMFVQTMKDLPFKSEWAATRESHKERCTNFAAGVTIPEGPDAPKLSDVLGALEAIRALCAHRRPGRTVSIGTCCQIEGRAQALLAAFKPVEPVQETSE